MNTKEYEQKIEDLLEDLRSRKDPYLLGVAAQFNRKAADIEQHLHVREITSYIERGQLDINLENRVVIYRAIAKYAKELVEAL